MKTFKEKREEFISALEAKDYYVDNKDDEGGGITFALTTIGLPSTYAEISKKEIEYHLDDEE